MVSIASNYTFFFLDTNLTKFCFVCPLLTLRHSIWLLFSYTIFLYCRAFLVLSFLRNGNYLSNKQRAIYWRSKVKQGCLEPRTARHKAQDNRSNELTSNEGQEGSLSQDWFHQGQVCSVPPALLIASQPRSFQNLSARPLSQPSQPDLFDNGPDSGLDSGLI